MPPSLLVFIFVVIATGTAVIAHSWAVFHVSALNVSIILLAALTIVSGRFAIKVPGRPATVSVSEVFVFASILLFVTPIPVLTVAIDGLMISLMQRDRRVYRTAFNIAEPAVSTWMAGKVFFAVSGVAPGSALLTSMPIVVPATVAMAGVFFVFNSGLSAVAVALETGGSVYEFWRGHAWALGVNYYAAASLATLAVGSGPW